MPVPSQRHIQPSRFFCAEPRRGSQIEGVPWGGFVCLEKTPCTLNASVQTYPAILTQKDDGKAPGIRANRRQKNRLRGKASASFERGCVVILLKGVLSR